MSKLTRNLATGLAAGALAVGAVLPALAQETPEANAAGTPVAIDHMPVRTRVQGRDAIRDAEMAPEGREAQLEARAEFRAARDLQHLERVEAAVAAGDLTEEQADAMLAAREERAEGGAGQRGPGAGAGRLGDGGRGRGMGPGDGTGPNEDCPLS